MTYPVTASQVTVMLTESLVDARTEEEWTRHCPEVALALTSYESVNHAIVGTITAPRIKAI